MELEEEIKSEKMRKKWYFEFFVFKFKFKFSYFYYKKYIFLN